MINDMTVAPSNMLQRSQNYCLRFVYDLRLVEHVTPFYLESKLLKLHDQRSIKILSLAFSILKTGLPKYFANDLRFIAQGSLRNSRSVSLILRMPQHRTAVYDRAFVVTACRLWNDLLYSLKSNNLFFERMSILAGVS